MYGEPIVADTAADYGVKLTCGQRRALDEFDALIKSGDPEIVAHLERQIRLLWDLYQRRREGRGNHVGIMLDANRLKKNQRDGVL